MVAGDSVLAVGAGVAAALEDGEAAADDLGVVDVVGDEDDADAARLGPDDELEDDRGLVDAERLGGIVHADLDHRPIGIAALAVGDEDNAGLLLFFDCYVLVTVKPASLARRDRLSKPILA